VNEQTMVKYLSDGQRRTLREIADACFAADIVAADHAVKSCQAAGLIYKPSGQLPFSWAIVPAKCFSASVSLEPGAITATKIERGAVSTQLSATAAHGEGRPHSCQTPASPEPGQSQPQSAGQSTDEGQQDQATPQSSPEVQGHSPSVRPLQSPSGALVDLPDASLSAPASGSPRQHTTAADLLRAERAMNEGLRSELQAARDVLALAVSCMDAAEVANLLITLQEAKP